METYFEEKRNKLNKEIEIAQSELLKNISHARLDGFAAGSVIKTDLVPRPLFSKNGMVRKLINGASLAIMAYRLIK